MAHDTQQQTGTVIDFLARLGARTPTPAGGSVAALCTAQAAALVAMVARFCDDPALVARAEQLVTRATQLMADDEAAVAAVASAWGLPRGAAHDEERRAAIDTAMLGAADPQAQVVETATEVLVLVDLLRPAARSGVRADLAAAAEVARAASTVARTNVESNLRGLPDTEDRARLLRRVGVTEESA
ncbi:MAG: formimidoyltetrahydrofolate cyclodeaminase [Marmoricola sp.]|nr:formimidoyltetrahydrofolate cyclodeaminase [Marmoricola sp.]